MNTPKLCFIGGSGRSGTTILREVLSRHARVATLGEVRFIVDPDGIVEFRNTVEQIWSPYLFDARLKQLEKLLVSVGRRSPLARCWLGVVNRLGVTKRCFLVLASRYAELSFHGTCPEYLDLVKDLIAELAEFRYRARWSGRRLFEKSEMYYGPPPCIRDVGEPLARFVYAVFGRVCARTGATHFVEDSPWNLLVFHELLRLFPEAKLVHMYRDPRDVVASFIKQRWAPGTVVDAAEWYRGIIERWWEIRGKLAKDVYLEVALEELVSSPENVLRRVCEFLKLEWSSRVLEVGLTQANSNRWRRDLSAADQAVVCARLASIIGSQGYSL